ncbi:hypothetical protein FH608_006015 [Nonomuraea phyllanthi]|uniref:Uncharacterized protein n=1 Tax=Nonomuraea phyllanthi TaxID=2219224 RepID=A0A5C4WTV6_9ACTN|nr:hypothetical protein [Nonomuraea phyllanthi]KAB8196317.1 hypothetical protein FH608_006015 [Nonomuraea phyllanthi]
MRTPRIVALTTAVAAAAAPMLALASPAIAEQRTTTTATTVQSGPLDWLTYTLNATQQLDRVKKLLGTGYVPQALSVSNAANPQYLSVWVKDATRKVNVLQGLSTTDLQKRIAEQLKLGYQPTAITGTGSGASTVFAAVFEKTTQKVQSKLAMTKDTFAKVNAQLSAAGFGVASLDVYGTVEKPLYAAVWVAGAATGAVKVSIGQTVEERGKELLTMARQGLRPVVMAVEPGNLITTVWSKGSTAGLKEYLNLSQVSYTLKSTQLKALGYQPTIVDTEGGRISSIWSKG